MARAGGSGRQVWKNSLDRVGPAKTAMQSLQEDPLAGEVTGPGSSPAGCQGQGETNSSDLQQGRRWKRGFVRCLPRGKSCCRGGGLSEGSSDTRPCVGRLDLPRHPSPEGHLPSPCTPAGRD